MASETLIKLLVAQPRLLGTGHHQRQPTHASSMPPGSGGWSSGHQHHIETERPGRHTTGLRARAIQAGLAVARQAWRSMRITPGKQ